MELNGAGEYRVVPFPADRKAIDIGDYYADYGLFKAKLGWTPQVSLRDGLSRSLKFYREYANQYW